MHHCKKYRLILFFLTLSYARLSAQDTLTFATVDSETYRLYEAGQWKSLLNLCHSAFAKNLDYYYLRVRAGIAAFELRRYREASVHFKKAKQFSSDDLVYEYLYFSYLYSGRYEEARKLTRPFSQEFATYMLTRKLNPISGIVAEGGVKLSDSTLRFKPALFGSVGLSHYIGRRVSLFHAFTCYSQEESRYTVQQYQYYLRGTVPLKHNLLLSAGAHVLYGNVMAQDVYTYPSQLISWNPAVISPTVYTRIQTMAVAGAVNLTKHFQVADVSLGASALVLDTAKQYQLSAGVLFYPLKNNELSVGGNCYFHTENYFKSMQPAFAPVLSTHIYKGLYLSLSYFRNDGLNIAEQTAYFVNNSYDYTLQRLSVTPTYVFSPKLLAYATAGLEEKKMLNNAFNYNYTVFQAGLRITPK